MATRLTPDVNASSLTVSPAERSADGMARAVVALRLVNAKGRVLTDREVSFTCLPENSVDVSTVTRVGDTYTVTITAREVAVLPTLTLEVAVDNVKLEGVSTVVPFYPEDKMSLITGELPVSEVSLQGDGKVNLPQLRECFKAWKVPSEESFSRLIDVASLPFKPGAGLTGGDPSTESEVVDVGGVTPWHVKEGNGVAVAKDGVALKLAADGGLLLDKGGVGIKAAAGVKVDKDGMAVVTSGPLKVGTDVSITLDEKKGLKTDKEGHVEMSLAPAVFDVVNGLRLTCQPFGGLYLDAQGKLALDIDTILGGVYIRVYQGQVKICIPETYLELPTKEICFYERGSYSGTLWKGGKYYIQSTNVGGYYIVTFSRRVLAGDVIDVRLFQQDGSWKYLCTHEVTEHESEGAPFGLPSVSELKVEVQGGGQPIPGNTLVCSYHFLDKGGKEGKSFCRFEYYIEKDERWGTVVSDTFTWTITDKYVEYDVRAWVEPKEEGGTSGSIVYSKPITIKKV
ncbi:MULTISPECIES: Ig-like domain-containing protein [Serratia]|uniref:Ig-like domain-containing protein n=1 Tax=Serratia TaxID=613 RepID=UPI0027E3FD70|nr:Ig-like domain-containing protein [Serratia marcescens]MCS3413216.1 Ig-like domain-containing protein [Serratia marcescens]